MHPRQIEDLYRNGLITRKEYHALVSGSVPSHYLPHLEYEIQRRISERQRPPEHLWGPQHQWRPEYFGQFMQEGPKCKEFIGKPTKVLHIKVSS